MLLKQRFLKYVAFDTQSDERSETYPSTEKQLVLLRLLVEEMTEIGLKEVEMDEFGYVTGTIPASADCKHCPVIGWLAHVDTSPEMCGAAVHPQIVEEYDGGEIRLNDHLSLTPEAFPELKEVVGHTLITTDGSTLLGADDKAGVAEIMTAAEWIITHPEIRHGKIRIAFTPDEEIGRGVAHFDTHRFGAQFAYTVDGGPEGELEYENFNAASATITVQGRNIHPGYAKGKMLNAIHILNEVISILPVKQRPEYTDGYEGFYHLFSFQGTTDSASAELIIRDHNRRQFEERKRFITEAVDIINRRYDSECVTLQLSDQYYNMREIVEKHPEIIEKACEAMRKAGVKPIVRPIRGGTDGANLSYMGLPCPNLFTGAMNFHGRFEYCSLDTMRRSVSTLIHLAQLYTV